MTRTRRQLQKAGNGSLPRVAALCIGVALSAGGVFGVALAADDCLRQSAPGAGFDPVVVCGDDAAQGTVALSGRGDARGTGRTDNPAVAVSGTGAASHAVVAVSGTGGAGGPHDPAEAEESGAAVAGTGRASGSVAAISGTSHARAPVAVSGTGDSSGQLVSVSGTGTAGGDTYTGQHPEPYIAVSGCRASHADHDDRANTQILTADPSRVHVLVDAEILQRPSKPADQWEATDVETGAAGQLVQNVTCGA